MKSIIYILFSILSFNGVVKAQEIVPEGNKLQVPSDKSLSVNSTLPDLKLQNILLNDKMISLNTKDFKDRLLVFDFWHTGCTSCIAKFPKLDSLQHVYGDKIKIISVTLQKEDVIRNFKFKNKLAKAFSLPILLNDTLLGSYFPYRTVPHMVWINQGKVIAISNHEYFNSKIIDKVLKGDKVDLPVKNDFIVFDFKKRSINGGNQNTNQKISSTITGHQSDAPTLGVNFSTVVDSVNGTVKDVFMNREIARLYIGLFLKLKPRNYLLAPDMIIIESKHPERYHSMYMQKDELKTDWMMKNAICYESVLPIALDEKQRVNIMIKDLDNKLGLNGRMEMRPTKVLIIKSLEGNKQTKDIVKSISKQEYKQFLLDLKYLAYSSPEFRKLPLIVDEFNQPNKQLDLHTFTDLPSLKRMLNLNGLDIIEGIRDIEVFVLTDHQYKIKY